jgi:hypothetical protein
VSELRAAEQEMRDEGQAPPKCGVDYWVSEISGLLNPQKVEGGTRPEQHGYHEYTVLMKQALEPFAPHGTLRKKIRDNGPGRLFRLEDLGADDPDPPVTVLIAARGQDHSNADTVLSLAITRLQDLLFERMAVEDRDPRPILLLLDETRRIRGFRPNEYITFAREAKAGCVLVYQSLDQIGDESKIFEILENVGTQIYLDSLTGFTARRFLQILPQRTRMWKVESTQVLPSGPSRTYANVKDMADAFSLDDLYRLPAGAWPALVYLSEPPRKRVFLVDLDQERLPKKERRDANAIQAEKVEQFESPPRRLSLSADGSLAVVLPEAGEVRTGSVPPAAPGWRTFQASSGAYAPHGGRLALGLPDGRIWLVTDERMLERHTEAVVDVAWSLDGAWLVSASTDGTLALTDSGSGRLANLIYGDFAAVAVAAHGEWIAMANRQGRVEMWRPGAREAMWHREAGPVSVLACHSSENALMWAEGTSLLRYAPGEADAATLFPFASPVRAIAFDAEGAWVASGLENGEIFVTPVGVWEDPIRIAAGGPVCALAFAREGKALYTAREDGTLLRLDLKKEMR